MNKKITVIVTGTSGGCLGEQLVKALRLAQGIDYRIIGTDLSAPSIGLADCDGAEVVPKAADPEYGETLLALCRKHQAKALFCGSEPEMKALSLNREAFRQAGIFMPLNPPELLDICLEKDRTAAFLRAHGFATVPFQLVTRMEEMNTIERFPVVIKPASGGGGSANVFLAQDLEELRFFVTYLLRTGGRCLVQEYVGSAEEEYTVGVLADMRGVILNAIAMQRRILPALSNRLKVPNRTGRRELGPVLAISNGISQGAIGRFPAVTGPCVEISRALGIRGVLNLQCRVQNGRVHVFEINPRFSGTTSLRALVGYNEPDILVRCEVLGENVTPFFAYREGVVLRGLREKFFPDAADRQQA
jgi:carbamoyl-phosphate synthase large subunit